ncbi:MAG: MBL fold metallo-hydrolase [Christensenellaceae bacterium]|jgi:L-ascorbate metabolism protein UlaG (beta-lactamase superfamily)|nr:MBL fold metallo-hydrolase [Christensenellaceae bacterium]
MDIKWLGHSCFLLTGEAGTRILMDPCDPDTGYDIAPVAADAVTSSHDHHDHNYFALAQGKDAPRITTPGRHAVKDAVITGYAAWHDDVQGALRGVNIMFVVEMDGMRLLHAGDLGHIPSAETIAAMGPIDVLLIPIGGTYTLDHLSAMELCNLLRPAVVIPMHYQTETLKMNIGELLPFLHCADKNWRIHRMRQSDAVITPESLGKDRIIVLTYEKRKDVASAG